LRTMDRKTFLLISLITAVFFPTYVLESANTIRAGSASIVSTQGSVTIPVDVSIGEDFSGYQFTLHYNKEILQCAEVRKGELIQDFNLLSNMDTPGRVQAGGFDPNLKGTSGSGTLAYITFTVTGSGSSMLSLSDVNVSSPDGQKIQIRTVRGRITAAGEREEEALDETGAESETASTPEASGLTPAERLAERRVSPDRAERLRMLRERQAGGSSAKIDAARAVPPHARTGPQTDEPTASDNLLLYVQSDYGNPSPQRGYNTYKRGATAECEVDKEVFTGEMEKAVCTGFKGTGSAPAAGNSNRVAFQVSRDTTLAWLWKKVPAEKDFILGFDKELEMDENTGIPVAVKYYGGLKAPVKLSFYEIPAFIEASFSKKELTYHDRETTMFLKKREAAPAGEYMVRFHALCDNIKKDCEVLVRIEGEIMKSVAMDGGMVTLTLTPFKNTAGFNSLQMEIHYPSSLLRLHRVLPESVRHKTSGKNMLALAGSWHGEPVRISFAIKKNPEEIHFGIEAVKVRDKAGNILPVKIAGE